MNNYLLSLEKNIKTNEQYKLTKTKADQYWKFIIKTYKDEYNFNLTKIKYIFDTKLHYNDGRIAPDINPESFGGSWTRLGIIYLNPNMYKAMLFYNPSLQITPEIMYKYVYSDLSVMN